MRAFTHIALAGALALGLFLPSGGQVALAEETLEAEEQPEVRHFGGSVGIQTALGRGTFIADSWSSRPWLGMTFSAKPRYRFDDQVSVALGMSLSVDLVENADAVNSRPQQVLLSDLTLSGRWSRIAHAKEEGLSFGATLALAFPTSLHSQYASRVLALKPSADLSWAPLDWLELGYTLGLTKNFNTRTSPTLDADDFALPPLGRAEGAESVAPGLTSTGAGVTSWGLSNALSAIFTPVAEQLTVTLSFSLVNTWAYQSLPADRYSSPYAQAGRARGDVMYGGLEVTWTPIEYLSVGLGTTTEQAPLTPDNESLRFPFWDTTNGAANRQVFYLDLTGRL